MIHNLILKTRLNKYLASSGLFSRRGADEVIKSGRVIINNNQAKIGDQIGDKDIVLVDGKVIKPKPLQYFVYNKPAGVLATKDDELKRETIYSSGKVDKSLSYAGRLDMGSEGLMILSNDGDFINKLTHPHSEIKKVYQLTLSGSPENLAKVPESFTKGLTIDNYLMHADKIEIESPNVFKVTLHQGYNRQLRKMSSELNLGVVSLRRIQIGKFKLANLKSGDIKSIRPEEVI